MNKKLIEPLGDRVAIIPDQPKKESPGGFIIPDSAVEKPKSGKIYSIGDDPKITLREGDNVLYGRVTGTEISVSGQVFVIMRQADVLCKINSDE